MDLNALIYNPNPRKNQYTLKAKIYSGEKRNIRKKSYGKWLPPPSVSRRRFV